MSVTVTSFDSTKNWVINRISGNVTLPISFSIIGNESNYNIILKPRITKNRIYINMTVISSLGFRLYTRVIKPGVQYDINSDAAIYFQSLYFNPYNLGTEGDLGTRIIYAYARISE